VWQTLHRQVQRRFLEPDLVPGAQLQVERIVLVRAAKGPVPESDFHCVEDGAGLRAHLAEIFVELPARAVTDRVKHAGNHVERVLEAIWPREPPVKRVGRLVLVDLQRAPQMLLVLWMRLVMVRRDGPHLHFLLLLLLLLLPMPLFVVLAHLTAWLAAGQRLHSAVAVSISLARSTSGSPDPVTYLRLAS